MYKYKTFEGKTKSRCHDAIKNFHHYGNKEGERCGIRYTNATIKGACLICTDEIRTLCISAHKDIQLMWIGTHIAHDMGKLVSEFRSGHSYIAEENHTDAKVHTHKGTKEHGRACKITRPCAHGAHRPVSTSIASCEIMLAAMALPSLFIS